MERIFSPQEYYDIHTESWLNKYIRELIKYLNIKSKKNIFLININDDDRESNIKQLKINNSELLTDYINSYNYYKRELLEKVKFSFPKFSILLGQYLLGILLHEGNYSYYSFRTNNTGSIYIHLGGPQKYAKLNKNKSII